MRIPIKGALLSEVGSTRASGSLPIRSLPRWLHEWGPELVFLLVTTGAGLWAAGRWINPFSDPGFSWSLAYRLAEGERLYRDIYFAYTPLSPYLLAAGVRVFGPSALYILLVNWIPAVAAGILLLRCGRSVLSWIERLALAGVVMAISLFVAGDGRLVFPYYPGAVHALLLSTAALLLLRDPVRLEMKSFVAGLLAGLAFCCKQEIGIAALFALGTVAFVVPRRRVAWAARLLAGFCVVLLPTAIFVLASAPVESLRLDSHFWPLALTPPPAVSYLMRQVSGLHDSNWPAALRSSSFGLLWQATLLALMSALLARERNRSTWLRVGVLFVLLVFWWILEGFSLLYPSPLYSLSMLIAFLVAILSFGIRSLPGRPFLIAIGTFAGLVGVRTAFSPFITGHYHGPGHFASALTWVVFLCVLAPRILLGEGRSALYMRNLMAVLLLCLSGWQALQGIESLQFPWRARVATREGAVFLEPGPAKLLELIGRRSTPGERALIIPETSAVDALFHLKNASPLIDLLPGWLDESVERQTIKRLEISPADIVVVFKRPVAEFGAKPFGEGFGVLLSEWISRNYEPVESCSAGEVLRRRTSAGPAVSHPEPEAGASKRSAAAGSNRPPS